MKDFRLQKTSLALSKAAFKVQGKWLHACYLAVWACSLYFHMRWCCTSLIKPEPLTSTLLMLKQGKLSKRCAFNYSCITILWSYS